MKNKVYKLPITKFMNFFVNVKLVLSNISWNYHIKVSSGKMGIDAQRKKK